jgi:Sec-independent protein translocase protein TatA
MSLSHMIILAIIVLVVVPPEKLPEVMRTIGSLLGDIRRQTSGIWDDLKKDAAFNPDDFFKKSDFSVKNLMAENIPNPDLTKPQGTDVTAAENIESSDDNKPKNT